MLPALPAAVVKASPGALGVAGLPPEDPLQAPPGRALRGVDERPAEDQQAGEAGRTERVSAASSLAAPQGLAEAGTCLQSHSLPAEAAPSASHLLLLWGGVLGGRGTEKHLSPWSTSRRHWGLLREGTLARRAGREGGGRTSAKAVPLLETRRGQGAFPRLGLAETSPGELC